MNRLLIFIYLLCIGNITQAQSQAEQVNAYTDKDCYLTGERLCVRVDATIGGRPSPSRVAYVEIADARRMYAQCMVTLRDGQGWAEIYLPTSMHSGCYQLAAYTRGSKGLDNDAVHYSIIGIINVDKLSRQDNIVFRPVDSNNVSVVQFRYQAGETAHIALPEFNALGGCISIEKLGLATDLSANRVSASHKTGVAFEWMCPEIEGHIVRATVSEDTIPDVWQTRLNLVGQSATLYDGKRQTDGSYLYYTSGIYGDMPVMVNAYDSLGHIVRMKLESPYMCLLPDSLPRLIVRCQEETLRELASAVRKQAQIHQILSIDSIKYSISFMNAEPDFIYDLDEYTQMNDIRELLVEFVKKVRKKKEHGINYLYSYSPYSRSYSKWPALVLLDGMPVNDIDEILKYDARLIKYIQIYSGMFNFGSSLCSGVISFITRGGRLSNYKLKADEQLMTYAFPQNRPDFVNYIDSHYGTLLWIPSHKEKELALRVPTNPGVYQITIQGRNGNGKLLRSKIVFEVGSPTVREP